VQALAVADMAQQQRAAELAVLKPLSTIIGALWQKEMVGVVFWLAGLQKSPARGSLRGERGALGGAELR
jgi:hypothetical protein